MIANDIVGVQPMDINHYSNWEKWFAWYPVMLRGGTTKVWLKTVYRRRATNMFTLLDVFGQNDIRSFFQRKIANRKNIKWQYDNAFGILKDK